mgnify:CR=1 FL=1
MIKGFIDHWCPTLAQNATWWKAPYETVREDLMYIVDNIMFDNFTFYTKWYTNGIYSRLGFLQNHLEASNVKTHNDWGRSIIELLHDNGKSVGFMLQLLSFEQKPWGSEAVVSMEADCMFDISFVAPVSEPCVFADFTEELYQQRVLDIIKEHLTEFPEVDYLFLEFEGYIVNRKLSRYLCEKLGMADPVTYSAETLEHCYEVMFDIDHSWSNSFQEISKNYIGSLFQRIEGLLRQLEFHGTVGVVFYGYGYETRYIPNLLPNSDWWLLPWDYPDRETTDYKLYTGGKRFVIPWEDNTKTVNDVCNKRVYSLKRNMIEWARQGRKVCYIGNGTIKSGTSDITEDLFKLSEQLGYEGYLCMGNPLCPGGLRWTDISDSDVQEAARLYKKLYGGVL